MSASPNGARERRRRPRQPLLVALIGKELAVFADPDSVVYAEVRERWAELERFGSSKAVDALAEVVGARIAVSPSVTAPIVARLLQEGPRTR